MPGREGPGPSENQAKAFFAMIFWPNSPVRKGKGSLGIRVKIMGLLT